MNAQHSLLISCFHWHKPDIWSGNRFANSLGIVFVILTAIAIGFCELGCNDAYLMIQLLELPGPVVSAGTGFHTNKAGWAFRYKGKQLLAGKGLAEDNFPICIHADKTERILGQINTDGCKLHVYTSYS